MRTYIKAFSYFISCLGGAQFSNAHVAPRIDNLNKTAEETKLDLKMSEIVLDIFNDEIDIQALESYIETMNLKYELIDFDGAKIRLKMPQKDKLILAGQIWSKK